MKVNKGKVMHDVGGMSVCKIEGFVWLICGANEDQSKGGMIPSQ